MNEHQRMQYLDAMGIDTYVPRVVLPAAKVSEQLHIPRHVQAELSETSPVAAMVAPSVAASAPGPQKASIDIQSVLSGAPKKDVVPEKDPVTTNLTSLLNTTKSTDTEQVRFTLALWRVGDWQIIDSRRSGDALPTDSLLANILQTLGLLEFNLPKVEMLHWPMMEKKNNQGWEPARAMVQGFLDGRLLSQPVSHIILMGQDANRAVLGEDINFLEQQFTTQAVQEYKAQALSLPSLSDLLYAPHLKRDTWLSLQALLAS